MGYQLLEHANSFLLADPGQAGHSDRQLKCLDLLEASFFCLDFQPKANGFSHVGQGPASTLQQPAQQREADDHLMPQQRPRTNWWG